MKSDHVESLEEIIFENRNKLYGAYDLRKKYSTIIVISLLIAVFFIGSALTYPLWMTDPQDQMQKKDSITVYVEPFRHRDLQKLPEPVPPPAKNPAEKKILAWSTPKVTDEAIDQDDPLPVSPVEPGPSAEPVGGSVIPLPPEKSEPPIIQPGPPEPYIIVSEMPFFPGGETELHKYFLTRIRYPREARESNIEGTVYLSFIIESNGTVSNIKVLRGIGGGCEEEAIRVASTMPDWTPGKQNGNPVRVKLTLPVKFTLN